MCMYVCIYSIYVYAHRTILIYILYCTGFVHNMYNYTHRTILIYILYGAGSVHNMYNYTHRTILIYILYGAGFAHATSNAEFNSTARPYFLDNVECEGTESTLLECQAQELGDHNCFRFEAAGVYCPSTYAHSDSPVTCQICQWLSKKQRSRLG